MPIERVNPEGLHATPGYHHVTVVTAGRMAHLAGQCPLDADGRLVGEGDLAAQVDQIVSNAMTALARSVLARRRRPLARLGREQRPERSRVACRASASRSSRTPSPPRARLSASPSLASGQLVEVDLTAALD